MKLVKTDSAKRRTWRQPDVRAAWMRTHAGDYAAYVIQRADGTVDAWIEQAGSRRNGVTALNSEVQYWKGGSE